jgi:hypothetical protein
LSCSKARLSAVARRNAFEQSAKKTKKKKCKISENDLARKIKFISNNKQQNMKEKKQEAAT